MDHMEVETEITEELVSNEKIVNHLKKLFEKYLDSEIIELVAYECGYDEVTAASHLIDMSRADSPLVSDDLIDLSETQEGNSQVIINLENPFASSVIENHVPRNIEREEVSAQELQNENMQENNFAEKIDLTDNKCEIMESNTTEEQVEIVKEQKYFMGEVENLKQAIDSKEEVMASKDISFAEQMVNVKQEKFRFGNARQEKSAAEKNVDRIIADAKRGIKILILLRGPPGCGKSHLGLRIIRESIGSCDPRSFLLSTDDFFNRNGAYIYDFTKINDAHKWNQSRAKNLLTQGVSPIIIDNTNTQLWEMKPYCMWAVENSYAIEILEPITPWAFNERELIKRNTHNVPKLKIREMIDRYEKGITVEVLFEHFNLCYRKKLPPQPRVFPRIPVRDTKILNTSKQLFMQPEEEAMQSWTILEPEHVNRNNPFLMSTDTKDAGMMTNEKNPFNTVAEKYITANEDFASAPLLPYKLPRDGFLDSSTMTEEAEGNDLQFANLSKLFEQIPVEYLKDVYEKCQYDIDWTLDILLADKKEIIENYTSHSKEKPKETTNEESTEEKACVELPKKIKQGTSETAVSLKKSLETSVVINKEHYSDNLKKLKRMDISDKIETCETAAGPVLIAESDEEFNSSDDSDAQETMELKVGHDFISQLDNAFGDPEIWLPDGFQPIIEIPVSLGRQLHALYLESLFKQIDMQSVLMEQMLKEDEEFAKKLQNQEFSELVDETPNLKEIMNDQKAISKQQKMVDEWKNLTPDDLAYKITVQKLTSNFPETDRETLIEILAAHDNCYEKTVEALISSGLVGADDIDTTAPVSDMLLMDMKVSHEVVMAEDTNINAKSAYELREEARSFQRRRQELLEKANGYYSRGMFPVAVFYSDLARKQTYLCEKYNSLAAEAFLSDHFQHNNHYNTIDLHFLYVAEALEALDRFLDNNIMLLINENKKTSEDLHIITGRGKNSRNGRPRIRPAVQKRLRERGIKMEKVNSGLIRARISRNTKMTTSL